MPAKIKYPVINGEKQCGQCGLWKDIGLFRPARTHYESKCQVCKKVYAAEYRQRVEVKTAQREYAKVYRLDPTNRAMLNAASRRWTKKPESKLKKNERRKEWTANVKQQCVDYKGGACQCCGYKGCLAALDFHHLDPETKEGYGTGGALVAHWTFERNRAELDKCILVCVRCHREIHAGYIKL